MSKQFRAPQVFGVKLFNNKHRIYCRKKITTRNWNVPHSPQVTTVHFMFTLPKLFPHPY